MKLLKTPIMKKLLSKGLKRARRMRAPNQGTFLPLFTHELKNGWYYQIDFCKDSRFYKKPIVSVYAFKPPRVYWAKDAEYVLREEV